MQKARRRRKEDENGKVGANPSSSSFDANFLMHRCKINVARVSLSFPFPVRYRAVMDSRKSFLLRFNSAF